MCVLLDVLVHMGNFLVLVNYSMTEHAVNVFILFISIFSIILM